MKTLHRLATCAVILTVLISGSLMPAYAQWYEAPDANTPVTTITMNADYAVTATFEAVGWDPWAYDADENGDISKPEALAAAVKRPYR